ncbi:MAG: 2OG-Fe(II) oxygenase [Myxococcota bacterium]|jgi:prolyl 4-hydroxylase|nr:2OG-Fe(II) oxygenase [Myxococcota bacterium]
MSNLEYVTIALAIASLAAAAYGARLLLQRQRRKNYVVRELPDFLTPEECDRIIDLAKPLIQKSMIVRKGEQKSNHTLRTSSTAFLKNTNDAIVKRVKRRIAEVTETDLHCQEPLQVTHYDEHEYYVPHQDALGSGGAETGEAGDRYCTLIVYLNDDYGGGCTCFYRIGARVKPERGKAVLFYNLTDDGSKPHPLSLHGAEPITHGEKWLANQWIRLRPYGGANRKARRAKARAK